MPAKISDADWVSAPGRYIIDDSGCWVWQGHLCKDGYGKCNSRAGQSLAHRAFYAILVGPIADGHEVDHLCRHRNCVNPSHLEAVKPIINRQRADHSTPLHRNRRKTHCKRGHPFSAENTANEATPSGGTARKCRTCRNAAARARRALG